MIKLVRVDERLIHGQVAFAWGNELGIDCFLVANNEVAMDPLAKTAMKLAVPAGMKIVTKNIEDSITSINQGKTDSYKLLVVVKNIFDATMLAKNVPTITEINLGGIKEKIGTTEIVPAINLTDEECKLVKDLINKGITVYSQQVPSDGKIDLSVKV